jgi:hypothetical protein
MDLFEENHVIRILSKRIRGLAENKYADWREAKPRTMIRMWMKP